MRRNATKLVSEALSVSEYLDAINLLIGGEQALVVGEVVELKTRGAWVSFSLKDAQGGAVLKCVLASWKYQRLGVLLEDGMLIKVGGTARITKHYGTFGFWVERVEPVGEGSLKRAYELLKKKLENEGLFARKRPLPNFVGRVGVITSKSGVVIHDFLKNLNPLGMHVYMYDSPVEGVGAIDGLAWALRYWQGNARLIEVLVLIRGGGGLESMQAFNSELVCRELFAMPVPVIAGIGHEVDVPLASFVSDVAVSTPTAAAHLVNSTWASLEEAARAYEPVRAFATGLDSYRASLAHAEQILRLGDPMNNLARGYSLTRDAHGKIVKSAKKLKEGERIQTQFASGRVGSKIYEVQG